MCGDIAEEITKDRIVDEAIKKGADIICGGPPCQGFSMAGFRWADDPRNQLFKEFIDVVKRVNPKIVVFENVEGLLSFQGGKIYSEILELFGDIGYNTEGRTLMANNYGVPQKRKRVIIICTRNDLSVKAADLFPIPITEDISNQVTAKEAIQDLEKVICGDKAKYLLTEESDIVELFKGKIDYATYVSRYHNSDNLDESTNKNLEVNEYEQLSIAF